MTEIYRFSESEIIQFGLVLLRLSAFVVTWPIFGGETVGHHLKILFALILALVIFPTLGAPTYLPTVLGADLVLLVLREVFVGLTIGFLARVFFFAFHVAGELIGQSMGLSAAQVFNPSLGGQSTAVEQFYVAMATFFYLAVNGHHYFLSGLHQSFQFFPIAQMSLNPAGLSSMGMIVQQIVEMGLRFSAPVVISILLVNLVLGVVGKTVPQLNVLITSFPINIMAGFFLMMITLPLLMEQMGDFLEITASRVFELARTF
ncbi:MAG: flagellar biosynthetic protein FliR [Bdellovibrionales bacterium]